MGDKKFIVAKDCGLEKRVVFFSVNLISMTVIVSDNVGISQELGALVRNGVEVALAGLVIKTLEVLEFL